MYLISDIQGQGARVGSERKQNRMTLKHINWKHYISTSDPPLPYDVTFRVFSQDDETHFREISGHKFLLASVSQVFQAQFFGGLANDQKVIKIKETTFEAFKEIVFLKSTLCFAP